jgi:hypothetical protein
LVKKNTHNQTLAICFGQFGPYHHARVAALQRAAQEMADGADRMADEGSRSRDTALPGQARRVIPVQIAAATTTYAWSVEQGPEAGDVNSAIRHPQSAIADGLCTLCAGMEEAASPVEVFLKARKLFKAEKVDVAFLPSYSPARYFALFAAAKSLGLRTVMMNESHAGTERATGWKKWIKRQIVRQFDAALVGGTPHKRYFAGLGIPEDKIFTGYDAIDNAYFAARADEIRSAAKKSGV